MYEFDRSGWHNGIYVMNCGDGFVFVSRGEVDAFWVVFGELEDRLLSETAVAFEDD